MKLTLFFVVLCCFLAISLAVPAPAPREINKQVPESVDDLKDGDEEEKDLKGAESAYHGWYGGYPYYPYSSYYSSIYHTPSYWGGYAYRPYSYWW